MENQQELSDTKFDGVSRSQFINGIATGSTTEDKKQRKRFIANFYKMWEMENPEKVNQKGFEKMILLEYDKQDFGKIKLTVGVKRGTKEKVQYCITAIEAG